MDAADSLDEQVRRADPDRWLSSRFVADVEARADLIALYAFDQELSHVLSATREPMMAEIRLTWWREAVDEIFAGKPARGHPALQALALAIRRRNLAQAPLDAMIEARFDDIEAAPFTGEAALAAYADRLCGAPLSLALAVLGEGEGAAFRPAAQAWAIARLPGERLPWDAQEARRRGLVALAEARPAARRLKAAAFPAVAHLALVVPRLKGRLPGPLGARLRLTLAVLSGRI
ncbi:squalene/phytoene synthase family protein [Phenylobacterium montanum]|uniref:Squalene/phytoene synthase family protein n=1 Tax=Phenylobacterium montanum TaxID=2823693 RepID=A0A975IUI5_9CAUL|nr:squalene/phytoene synthase family protein [Caulobacter sp. S6]QUD87977.1 squalene/phytoene synthase family protein [Caulobacter sp. S6]